MSGDRYQRHSLIDWFDQDRVRDERIIVVGAGAVGNEVIKNLVLLGVGEIHVFDLDTVEVHNLTRSVLFRECDIGRPKALCAAERARELDPAVCVRAHHGDFWVGLSFDLLRSSTGVFCCADNFEARVRLSRLCALVGVPLVNTGVDSRYAVVERFPFARGRSAPCYECGLPLSAYSVMARRYSCGGLRRIAREEAKIPTTILTASLAGALSVSVYLQGSGNGTSTRHFQDSFTGQTTVSELSAREGCPCCGDLRQPRVLLRGRRQLVPLGHDGGPPTDLRCSDRVLVSVRCRSCESDRPPTVVFQLADRFDERFARCPACGETGREIVVRDRFDAKTLVESFGGRPMPGKFVIGDLEDAQVVVELEE